MKKLFAILAAALLLLIAVAGCGKPAFVGNEITNESEITLDFSVLNTTKTYEMNLEQGAAVNVVVENESGTINLLVTGPDGNAVYKADRASSGVFAIEIPAAGTYTFAVTGSDAAGVVSFALAEASAQPAAQ